MALKIANMRQYESRLLRRRLISRLSILFDCVVELKQVEKARSDCHMKYADDTLPLVRRHLN